MNVFSFENHFLKFWVFKRTKKYIYINSICRFCSNCELSTMLLCIYTVSTYQVIMYLYIIHLPSYYVFIQYPPTKLSCIYTVSTYQVIMYLYSIHLPSYYVFIQYPPTKLHEFQYVLWNAFIFGQHDIYWRVSRIYCSSHWIYWSCHRIY